MAVEVGIVGLPGAGKTTLFHVLTGTRRGPAGAKPGTASLGSAPIPDGRLEPVARTIGSPKVTPATLKVIDVAGTEAGSLGALRSVDALIAVVDGYSAGADPARDLETLALELLVADRDHVERRLERVRQQAKSGDPTLRKEAASLADLLAQLEQGRPLAEWDAPLPAELEPLTTKPLIELRNGPDGVDLKLEAELAELEPEEAASFRDGPSALEEIVRRVWDALGVIRFFTANENEARAWTLPGGGTALQAAAAVHTDLARGFIRCEVISAEELIAAGSRAEAARRGQQRLEGKAYRVADGDVLNIRFSPAR